MFIPIINLITNMIISNTVKAPGWLNELGGPGWLNELGSWIT